MEKKQDSAALSLKKRGNAICILGALILYLNYISNMAGGPLFLLFFPLFTGIYLVCLLIVYFPARICVRNVLNKELPKILRGAFLLLVLVPYALLHFYFFQQGELMRNSTPEAVSARAQREIESYETLYDEHRVPIKDINDRILLAEEGDFKDITGISLYRKGAQIYVALGYENPTYPELELVEGLFPKDIADIERLFSEMSIDGYGVSFKPNCITLEILPRGVSVQFLSPDQLELERLEGYGSEDMIRELDDGWYVRIVTLPYFYVI